MRTRIRGGLPGLRERHPVLHDPGAGPDGGVMSPTWTQKAAVATATASLVELLDGPAMPTGKRAAVLVLDAVARHAQVYDTRRLDRRMGAYAASFAVSWLRYWNPGAAPIDLAAAFTSVDVAPAVHGALERLAATLPGSPAVPLLAFPAPTGGLILDELSVAHRADAVLAESYTTARVASLLLVGSHLPPGFGPFAGVRVLSPRVPAYAAHVPPTGLSAAHRLGDCPACTLRSPR